MAKDKKSKPKHKYTIPEILVGLVLFTALFAGLIGAVTGSSETSKSDIAIGEKNDPYIEWKLLRHPKKTQVLN